MTGTQQQKNTLLGCVGCHTVERIVSSKYDTEASCRSAAHGDVMPTRARRCIRKNGSATRDTDLVGEDQARVQRAQAEWLEHRST